MLNTNITRRGKARKIFALIMAIVLLVGLLIAPVYAENELAEKGAKWLLDGIFWIVIVLALFAIAKLVASRNFVGMMGVILGAAIVALLCKKPEILSNLGNILSQQLGL